MCDHVSMACEEDRSRGVQIETHAVTRHHTGTSHTEVTDTCTIATPRRVGMEKKRGRGEYCAGARAKYVTHVRQFDYLDGASQSSSTTLTSLGFGVTVISL